MHPLDLINLTLHHICHYPDLRYDDEEFCKIHAVLSETWTVIQMQEVKKRKTLETT